MSYKQFQCSMVTSLPFTSDSLFDDRRRRLVLLRPGGGPVQLLPAARDRLRGPEGGLGLAPLGSRDHGGADGELLAGTDRRTLSGQKSH